MTLRSSRGRCSRVTMRSIILPESISARVSTARQIACGSVSAGMIRFAFLSGPALRPVQQQPHAGGDPDAHAACARAPAQNHLEGLVAAAAVDRPVLSGQLHRPHQRLLRGAHHEQGPGSDRRTCTAGAPASSSSATPCSKCRATWSCRNRRAPVDRPHHDHVGHHLRADGHRHRPCQLPRAALSAGHGRGRLFPGHDFLSDLLVPVRSTAPAPSRSCTSPFRCRTPSLRSSPAPSSRWTARSASRAGSGSSSSRRSRRSCSPSSCCG